MTEKAFDAVTLNWAARFLGVSLRKVQRLIADGKITAYRYSKRCTRVDYGSVKAYRSSTTIRDTSRQ